MTPLSIDDIRSLLVRAFDAQAETASAWHGQEPHFGPEPPADCDADGFIDLVLRQHWCHFRIWHVENRARRKDAAPALIADCKYAFDKLNLERNDLMERIDAWLVAAFAPLLPPSDEGRRPRCNTGTMGMALDRGSILALKLHHLTEQSGQAGLPKDFATECGRRLKILAEQRADLQAAVLDLADDYAAGRKRPKVYYHFKMYNDPRLNPELYGRKAGS
jgi:hypothetical protein